MALLAARVALFSMVAGTFATLAHGGSRQGVNLPLASATTVDPAAALFNVSSKTVKDARVVQASGDAAVSDSAARPAGANDAAQTSAGISITNL
jgi:hypothetical protein